MGTRRTLTPLRVWLAGACGVATAIAAGLTVGEYELRGLSSVAAGALVGVVVAEVVAAVSGARGLREHLSSALLAAGAMAWGSWIASGRGIAPIPASAWAGVAVALAAGGLGVGGRSRQSDRPDASGE